MKLNQKLIQQLCNGEIAAENDGTLGQLTGVLKAAFPEDKTTVEGGSRFYFMNYVRTNEWDFFHKTNLPVVSASDFYQAEPQPNNSTSINYLVDGMEYSFNYQELKSRYEDISQYSDEEFMQNLPQIAHLACVVSTLKGLGTQATIGDKGIIHELIHLMTDPEEPTNDLQEIRESFNKLIQLV